MPDTFLIPSLQPVDTYMNEVLSEIAVAVRNIATLCAGTSLPLWDRDRERFAHSASTIWGQPPSFTAQQVRRVEGAPRWIVDHAHPRTLEDIEDDRFKAHPIDSGYAPAERTPQRYEIRRL